MGRRIKNIDGTRPRAVVRPVSKGRFRTLLSVLTNLANLNLNAAVMQQRRLRRLILYLPAALYLYNYIIRCTPSNRCALLWRIWYMGLSGRSVSCKSLGGGFFRVAYLSSRGNAKA